MHKRYLIITLLCAVILLPLFSIYTMLNNVIGCDDAGEDYFLGYCGNPSYGDYEHAAYYFDIEQGIRDALKSAEVVFLGNSKTQITFSNETIDSTLKNEKIPYHMMGFNAQGGEFARILIEKYKINPPVYIINADSFFFGGVAPDGKILLEDKTSYFTAINKKISHKLYTKLCSYAWSNHIIRCPTSGAGAMFRSRATGAWKMQGVSNIHEPFTIPKNDGLTEKELIVKNSKIFFNETKANPECTIYTVIPAPNFAPKGSQLAAKELGVPFILPEVADLRLMDCCHLDLDSSERWSKAFIKQAMPIIKRCLAKQSYTAP